MAEICSPADNFMLVIYGQQDDHVVQMADGPFGRVRIVGDEDVSFVDSAADLFPTAKELCGSSRQSEPIPSLLPATKCHLIPLTTDERPELPDL